MTKEWKCVEVDGTEFIPFEWRDDQLGRAEFIACMKFKRGKIFEYWVYPVQTKLDVYWHYQSSGYPDFMISAYEGLEQPKMWLAQWCKEHKTPSMRIYAPPYAKYIQIYYGGISFWKRDLSKV